MSAFTPPHRHNDKHPALPSYTLSTQSATSVSVIDVRSSSMTLTFDPTLLLATSSCPFPVSLRPETSVSIGADLDYQCNSDDYWMVMSVCMFSDYLSLATLKRILSFLLKCMRIHYMKARVFSFTEIYIRDASTASDNCDWSEQGVVCSSMSFISDLQYKICNIYCVVHDIQYTKWIILILTSIVFNKYRSIFWTPL